MDLDWVKRSTQQSSKLVDLKGSNYTHPTDAMESMESTPTLKATELNTFEALCLSFQVVDPWCLYNLCGGTVALSNDGHDTGVIA